MGAITCRRCGRYPCQCKAGKANQPKPSIPELRKLVVNTKPVVVNVSHPVVNKSRSADRHKSSRTDYFRTYMPAYRARLKDGKP